MGTKKVEWDDSDCYNRTVQHAPALSPGLPLLVSIYDFAVSDRSWGVISQGYIQKVSTEQSKNEQQRCVIMHKRDNSYVRHVRYSFSTSVVSSFRHSKCRPCALPTAKPPIHDCPALPMPFPCISFQGSRLLQNFDHRLRMLFRHGIPPHLLRDHISINVRLLEEFPVVGNAPFARDVERSDRGFGVYEGGEARGGGG